MKNATNALAAVLGLALLAAAGGGLYIWQRYAAVAGERDLARAEAASSTEALRALREAFASSTAAQADLATTLESLQRSQGDLVAGKVDAEAKAKQLEKLVDLDPQLLSKYSKTFFLNENYRPESLLAIPKAYLANPDKPEQIHPKVLKYLERLIDDAAAEGATLQIVSAYRSFSTQKTLKTAYTVTYGVGANAFSADQGYSEHQLGTTVDLSTPGAGLTASFADTTAGKWLAANAYRYGFELSYPAGNAYYVYEPWHWRFVGVDLAAKLHREGKNFYDLSQRDIDEYLVRIFD